MHIANEGLASPTMGKGAVTWMVRFAASSVVTFGSAKLPTYETAY